MKRSITLYLLFRFFLDALVLGVVALAASYAAILIINASASHPVVIGLSVILIGVLLLWLDEQLARMG